MAPKNVLFSELRADLPASIVVFLVALPLCLGIALASGAPLFSGLITGIIGGIIVGTLSGSPTSVSGPAAGLTAIVLAAINDLGSFQVFLVAVVLAGLIQLILGYVRAGTIGYFFPDSVIKGMLAAIGLILILKQFPHAIGYDADYEGDSAFVQQDGHNTFSEIWYAMGNLEYGAFIIAAISLAILILLEQPKFKKITFFKFIPGPLIVVILGVIINEVIFAAAAPNLQLFQEHLVTLPVAGSTSEFISFFMFPDFSVFREFDMIPQLLITSVTIALVASLETLLSVEATDKLDPYKRLTPTNRELKAQGTGNILAGLIGGLPMTAVIVRSTANVSSGAKTKTSAVIHGVWLLLCVALIPTILNLIPLSSLAAILLMVGYKLAKPSLVRSMIRKGMDQFLPFIITIVAILFTDLLIGILIGICVGLFFVIKTNFHTGVKVTNHGNNWLVRFQSDVSFLNKATLRKALGHIPDGSSVVFDGKRASFIDTDILEIMEEFEKTAPMRDIKVKKEFISEIDGDNGKRKLKHEELRTITT